MAASENLASSLQALLIRFQQEFSEKVASVEERLRERETRLAREWEALETEKKSLLKLRQEMEREREQLQRDREQLEREREAVVERTRLQATEISTNDEGQHVAVFVRLVLAILLTQGAHALGLQTVVC